MAGKSQEISGKTSAFGLDKRTRLRTGDDGHEI
nr:MAG TPA: hypothetical protein [Caudoviricetes sp.]